jgi:hypothetical protein
VTSFDPSTLRVPSGSNPEFTEGFDFVSTGNRRHCAQDVNGFWVARGKERVSLSAVSAFCERSPRQPHWRKWAGWEDCTRTATSFYSVSTGNRRHCVLRQAQDGAQDGDNFLGLAAYSYSPKQNTSMSVRLRRKNNFGGQAANAFCERS